MRTMVCEQCDREPKNAFLALRSRTLSKRSSAALLAASPAPLADGRGPCVFATRTRPRPRGSRGLTTPRPVATKQGSIARSSLPPRIIVRPHPCFRQGGCGVEPSRAESRALRTMSVIRAVEECKPAGMGAQAYPRKPSNRAVFGRPAGQSRWPQSRTSSCPLSISIPWTCDARVCPLLDRSPSLLLRFVKKENS
jgi:hypothetical protein